jgi:hypothetical protein
VNKPLSESVSGLFAIPPIQTKIDKIAENRPKLSK